MKTSLLCLGLASILVGTASAQSPQALYELSNAPRKNVTVGKDFFTPPPAGIQAPLRKTENSTQAIQFTNMYRCDYLPYFETANGNSVFVYEPASKTTALVRANRVFANNSLTGGVLRMYTTSDNGATWNETEVLNEPGKLVFFPNLGIVNPQGAATKFDDLVWTVFGGLYEKSGDEWPLNGSLGVFKPTSGQFEFPMAGPDNAPSDMGWSIVNDMISMNAPNPSVYLVSRLRKTNDNGPSQYGTTGTWGYDFDAEDFTTNTIPDAWSIGQFVTPDPPNLNSTLNTSPLLSSDADGKLYMAGNLIFTSEAGKRVPAVSMSEDQGVTWSDFVKMPSALLDEYMTSRGWNNINSYGTYDGDAFVVTGPNKWSFFCRVGTIESNQWAGRDIVEARYDNGTWTLNKVAELVGFPIEFQRQDSISNLAGQYEFIPSYEINQMGCELEAAITADGKDLLVKWIDDNPELVDSGFTQKAFYKNSAGTWIEDELKAMVATDIFMANKPVDGSTWSTPLNMTNDRVYDHGTRIPRVIESLTNVPLLTLKGIAKSELNDQYPWSAGLKALPDMILDATTDFRAPNAVRTAFINSKSVSDVKDEAHFTFRVNSVSPNPATNEAELAFTMDVPGSVSVGVFTNTGMKVASVYNGMLQPGLHGMTINTEAIANGTYYIVLNVGSQRITRPLVVVR